MSSLSSSSSSTSTSLRIDTSLTSADPSRRPDRLGLSRAKIQSNPAALPSALATARVIEDIASIQYPEGVKSPKPELNVNAGQGQFRYDRDFLLQFMAVCKEKPDSLAPLDEIGLEPMDQNFTWPRGGLHGRRSSNAVPPLSRQAIVGLKKPDDHSAVSTRSPPMSGGSKRGGKRGDYPQVGPTGWAVSRGAAARPSSKASDLSKFGEIVKSAPMTFGPSSVFGKGDKSKSRESTIHQGSTNIFSMLSGNPEIASGVTAGKSSRRPSRATAVGLALGGFKGGAAPSPHQRKLPEVLPRTSAIGNAATVDLEDEADEYPSGTQSMSEAEAKARIEEDAKEFFSIRDLEEAEVYFTKLPSEHRHLLVDKLVTRTVESKWADAQLVADLFDRVVTRNLCSTSSFEQGFAPTAEIIDDIAIDAPRAPHLFALMMKGAHLHEDEERRTRLASKSMDSDKLVALLS